MKVLLLDSVKTLGVVGDVVEVKRGYAVNYLLPRRLAVIAQDNIIKAHQAQIENARVKMEEQKVKINEVIEKINGIEYRLEKKLNKDKKMFGSVTEKDIKGLLSEYEIDWQSTELDLSKVGKDMAKYSIDILFDYGLKAQIVVNVQEKK